MLKTLPLAAIVELGLTEIIDKDDQVDQNDFSASVELDVSIGDLPVSGEILAILLRTTETGSGSILSPAGELIFLDADPAASAGDTALTAAEWATVLGKETFAAADWITDANGGVAYATVAIPFHELASLYAVWLHTDATSFNDAAGDDEELHMNLWYRRDS